MTKKLKLLIYSVLASMFLAAPAYAISIGEVSDAFADNFSSLGGMVTLLFLLIGIVLVGVGLMKFNAWRNDPRQTPLATPVLMVVIGGAMAVITGIMTVTGDSSGLTGEGTGLESSADDARGFFE